MTTFYTTPPFFTDRISELSTLDQVAADLLDGRPRHIALFGLRRIGKTLVCQEQMRRLRAGGRVIPIYLDLEDLATAPENICPTVRRVDLLLGVQMGSVQQTPT